jgi:hypothetical protein
MPERKTESLVFAAETLAEKLLGLFLALIYINTGQADTIAACN